MPTERERELRELFDAHQPWLHLMYVDGVPTKLKPAWGEPLDNPRGKWEKLKPVVDAVGKRVLDVGCNDGFYLFACRELGATQCVGIEASGRHYRNAELMKDLLGTGNVEVHNMSAYEIDQSLGTFDTTLLLGLIYHLKNPLQVIDRVAAITTGQIVVETALRNSDQDLENRRKGLQGKPSMDFVENPFMPTSDKASLLTSGADQGKRRYEGAPNWWLPNAECVCSMLRSAGFNRTEVIQEVIPGEHEEKNVFGRGIFVGYKE